MHFTALKKDILYLYLGIILICIHISYSLCLTTLSERYEEIEVKNEIEVLDANPFQHKLVEIKRLFHDSSFKIQGFKKFSQNSSLDFQ